MTKSSLIGGAQLIPKRVKEMGAGVVSEVSATNQRKMICPFLSFLVLALYHLKDPSNKLKEPCQIADSIINHTSVSSGLPGISKGLSASPQGRRAIH